MFDHLMESRPRRDRSIGQIVVSVALHTAIIAISIRYIVGIDGRAATGSI